MKRASYREGVKWIALNDDPGASEALNINSVAYQISVMLLADLFGKDQLTVAADIVKARLRTKAENLESRKPNG